MGDYGRYSLQGALAGLIAAIPLAVLTLVVVGPAYPAMVEDLVRYQLSRSLPPEYVEETLEEVLGRVGPLLSGILAASPLLVALQQALLGAVFGLLKGFLRLRLGLGEAASVFLTGLAYLLLLGVVPVVGMELLQPELLGIVGAHVGNVYLLVALYWWPSRG